MNLDHPFAYVVGGFCAYLVAFCAAAELAAWNRRRAQRARDNAKVRAVRRQMRADLEAELEQDRYDREFALIRAHFKETA